MWNAASEAVTDRDERELQSPKIKRLDRNMSPDCKTSQPGAVNACLSIGQGAVRSRTNSIPRGWIAATVLVCALVARPGWALELAEIDQAGPEVSVPWDSAKNMVALDDPGTVAASDSLSQFRVTPADALEVTSVIGEAEVLPMPMLSLLFFTPRAASFDIDREDEAGTCKFISPEIDGATCYKYSVGKGADLELGAPQGSGLVSGSAMDQALAQGMTEGLPSELHTGLEAGAGVEKAFAVGIEYQKQIQELDLGLSTSLRTSAKELDGSGQMHPEVQSWKLGLSAGYTGFTFSTSYFEERVQAEGERLSYGNLDSQETFDLGVKYDLGPWAFGVQYSHSELDMLRIGPDQGDQKVDSYEIGGTYLMGQRLSLGAAIQFWKWDEFASTSADDEQERDLLFLVGSHLKF